MFVISSKKFRSLDKAFAQMFEWEQNGTLNPKATIYEVKNIKKYKRVLKLRNTVNIKDTSSGTK